MQEAHAHAVALGVDFDGVDDLVDEFDGSLSTGRSFFATDREHAIASAIRLTLVVPGLREPITLGGTVAAVHDGGIDVAIDPVALATLREIVERARGGDPAIVQKIVRVLLVEDNQHVAELLRGGLRKGAGADVAYVLETAPDGREALARMSADRWDLVLVDVYLPVLDGAEVIRRARAADEPQLRDLPIIALSAGGEAARKAALDAGATAFLEKPVRLRQVIETVREHCAL
jgi:CheY-like chemotaxis protein